MKTTKILALVLALLLAVSFASCGNRSNNTSGGNTSTTPPQSSSAPPAELRQSESNPSNEVQTPSNNELGIELFIVPDMTSEQQSYYTDYVGKLVYSGMLIIDWSADDYSSLVEEQAGLGYGIGYVLLFAFQDIIGQDAMQKLFDEYNGIFPAGVIEDILLIRFPFTAEQLHEILSNHYDAETETYHYESGRGGGPIEAAVVDAAIDGDFIRLYYELFNGYSGLDIEPNTYLYKTPGILTLKQNMFGGYTFWSVEVGEQIEAPTIN